MTITKIPGIDYPYNGLALTLTEEHVTHSPHPSGWTITGEVYEDYFTWVNEFEATHPTLGRVWGDFEKRVEADSQEAWSDFMLQHPPEDWDYGEI